MSVQYPVVPLRNAVAFPQISLPLVIGRPRSLAALRFAQNHGRNLVVIVSQKVLTSGDPTPADLHSLATLCRIETSQALERGTRQVVVSGVARFRVHQFYPCDPSPTEEGPGEEGTESERAASGMLATEEPLTPCLLAEGSICDDLPIEDPIRAQALLLTLRGLATEVLKLQSDPQEALSALLERIDDPSYLADLCGAYLGLPVPSRQKVLEALSLEARIEYLLDALQKEREVLQVQGEIRDKMSERLGRAQRDALLREQIRTIRAELGEESPEEGADELTLKLRAARLPEEASKVAQEELKRLRALPPSSAEHHVLRSYLEWLAVMPWRRATPDQLDLQRGRTLLDEDHAGLTRVKKRILQHLAVARLRRDLRGPILCLLGPPGTGKTSLGKSIARVMGRRFVRAALGGVRDEAEIRGHRRTYVGAMPGRIIQGMKRAGVRNPVMLLDEIDKLRQDFHGDPAAALLEVLDPEQNTQFVDHYLDVPFDLSEVFFIATANSIEALSPALRDRLEVIEIPSYTIHEKVEIARNHLIPESLREHGLGENGVLWDDESLLQIITRHTREAGVRELVRQIAAVHRVAAEQTVARVQSDLGPPAFPSSSTTPLKSRDLLREAVGPDFGSTTDASLALESEPSADCAGLSLAMAWTPTGGEILPVETRILPHRNRARETLVLTGNLGEVMRESARIALTLLRSLAVFDSLESEAAEVHIHLPHGATPKEGPSAGLALFLSLVSAVQERPFVRRVAVTGEITLRGRVLPVGGIREKLFAAHRAGLREVMIPFDNQRDLQEVPAEVLGELRVIPVRTVDEALSEILTPLTPVASSIVSIAS